MSLYSTNVVPVITVITLVFAFSIIHSLISRFVRGSNIISRDRSSYLSSLISIIRIDMSKTSIYSLIISLIRLNIIFYAVSELLLNNLFGSDTSVYFFVSILCYVLTSEFLRFVKTKTREEMNEVSVYLLFSLGALALIAISKGSINLSVETNSLWLDVANYFNNWEVLNIPLVFIPVFSILIFTEQRIISSRKELYLRTFDGSFDLVSEKLLYLYLCLIIIKSLFGGVDDLSFLYIESSVPYTQICVLLLKFILISVCVQMCLKFKSMSKNVRYRREISMGMVIATTVNIALVVYLRQLN